MAKMLVVTAVILLAVLAVQVIVAADDSVVVNPAPAQGERVKTGMPGAGGFYGAYVPPVPVPPGVATPYNLPCATPNGGLAGGWGGGMNVEYLVRELGERR